MCYPEHPGPKGRLLLTCPWGRFIPFPRNTTKPNHFLASFFVYTLPPHEVRGGDSKKSFIPLLFPPNFKCRARISSTPLSPDSKPIGKILYLLDLYILLCFDRAEKRCEMGTERDEERQRNEARIRRRKMMVLYQNAKYVSRKQRSLTVEEGLEYKASFVYLDGKQNKITAKTTS